MIVTLRFPSSHVDLSKSDYDLIVKLLRSKKCEHNMEEEETAAIGNDSTVNPQEETQRSSLEFPYGEFVQKQRNMMALNVFFTQGNWVLRESNHARSDEARDSEEQSDNEHVKSSRAISHCYELEFVKLHIFQLLKHAGTVRGK